MYDYVSTDSARLWRKSEDENDWNLFSDKEMSKKIEDIEITPQDVLMVEMKINNYWPRNKKEEGAEERDWREFELGDKVDIKKEGEWKIGQVKKILKNNTQILVHFLHEPKYNDEKIPINSFRVSKFGTHTLEQMFKGGSDSQVAIPGIKNLGNTCYMNSILQCLIYTPLLKEFFIEGIYERFKHSKSSTLITALASTMKESEKEKILKPFALKKAVNKELTLFYGFEQCDAQEFLMFFMNKIAEDLRRFPVEDESEILKIQEEQKVHYDEQQAGHNQNSNHNNEDELNEISNENDSVVNKISEGKHGKDIQINKPKTMTDIEIKASDHKGRHSDSFTKSDALKAWEKEYKELDSPIKDLFAGQTA